MISKYGWICCVVADVLPAMYCTTSGQLVQDGSTGPASVAGVPVTAASSASASTGEASVAGAVDAESRESVEPPAESSSSAPLSVGRDEVAIAELPASALLGPSPGSAAQPAPQALA